jgi:hypothetical protein
MLFGLHYNKGYEKHDHTSVEQDQFYNKNRTLTEVL